MLNGLSKYIDKYDSQVVNDSLKQSWTIERTPVDTATNNSTLKLCPYLGYRCLNSSSNFPFGNLVTN